MIVIEKETVETLKSLVQFLLALLGILTTVVIPGIFWFIRRVDIGANRRIDDQELRHQKDMKAQKETIDAQDRLIASLRDTISILQTKIQELENTQVFYKNRLNENNRIIVGYREKIAVLEEEVNKLVRQLEVIKHSEESSRKAIINKAVELAIALGYSNELSNAYVEYLEGRMQLDDFVAIIVKERLEGHGNSFNVGKVTIDNDKNI